VKKLAWYATRLRIETFTRFNIRLQGRSQTANRERIVKLIAAFRILSWQIFWMTMMNRNAARVAVTLAHIEIQLLDGFPSKKRAKCRNRRFPPIQQDRQIGRISRPGEQFPPGNTVMLIKG